MNKNLKFVLLCLLISGCDGFSIDNLRQNSKNFINISDALQSNMENKVSTENRKQTIQQLLDHAGAKSHIKDPSRNLFKSAVENDPSVIAISHELSAMQASADVTKSQKDFQVFGTLYGGMEDVSDDLKGIALVLNANRLIFDGGALDAQITTQNFSVQSKLYALRARIDERLLHLASIWVELERYVTLNKKIEDRVAVLSPLINKLQQVAEAGLGDVSQVAAAQRTVTKYKSLKLMWQKSLKRQSKFCKCIWITA